MIPISKVESSLKKYLHEIQDTKWRYTPQILMGLVIVATVTLLFPSSQSLQFANFKEGDVYTGEEIIAPFTFFVNKSDEEITEDRKNATEEVPLVFKRIDSLAQKTLNSFDMFYKRIHSIHTSAPPDSIKLRTIRDILNNYSVIVDQSNIPLLIKGNVLGASDNTIKKEGKSGETTSNFEIFMENLRRIMQDTYAIGIMNLGPNEIPDYVDKISVMTADRETLEDINDYFNLQNYKDVVLENLRQTFAENENAVKLGYSIITAFLVPNLIFDKPETDRRINEAVTNVPLSKGIVLENERIVNTHERITKDILEKLNSLAEAKQEREAQEGGMKLVWPYLGRILITCLALSFALMFLMVSRKEIFNNSKKMLMIFIVFMLIIGIAFLTNQFGTTSNLKYLIPVAIASMLLTIFYDSRVAFIGTVALSILIGALRGNEFGIMVVSLFVGTISTFSVREIQARSWILKAILTISASYIVAIGAVEMLKHTEISRLWEMWFYGIINGVLSPILTYGLMIIFEYIFQFTTNSTLLELSDLNKPLLRQLAIRAPGTYHHSIMVGNLSEAACEAIGANALLARVASYYHDIGKMEKPDYFVENQKGGRNPHEKLTPTMSCLILINHVKRGMDIAEEYNLPKEICDIIPQHHGTNLIRYFYQKAKENSDGQEVNEASFRYHGPKPQSKEAGVVMLADAVEAGSRTLKDPTVSRIRSMVTSFTYERLLESELDECPLTLRDLNFIRESFVNNLTGMFHGRIEYPDK